jgi:orotidine-5'-phosphate decarboxylase
MPSSAPTVWLTLVEPFGARLASAFDTYGQLCVGIDPHSYLLGEWGLPDTAAGVREFGMRVVDAAAGKVGIIKPQVAFFERHGSAGFAALEDIFAAARLAGLLVIADAKRGDLGTSVEAYGQAWLSPGSTLEADALTISAYMGVGSIERPMQLAEEHGKGLFVLAATSNPEAHQIQTAKLITADHIQTTVAAGIVKEVVDWNAAQAHGDGGSIGLVLGATVDFADYGIDLATLVPTGTPVLAPGFGHQGAQYKDLGSLYGAAAPCAIVAASRSILIAGPSGISAAITQHAREVYECRA